MKSKDTPFSQLLRAARRLRKLPPDMRKQALRMGYAKSHLNTTGGEEWVRNCLRARYKLSTNPLFREKEKQALKRQQNWLDFLKSFVKRPTVDDAQYHSTINDRLSRHSNLKYKDSYSGEEIRDINQTLNKIKSLCPQQRREIYRLLGVLFDIQKGHANHPLAALQDAIDLIQNDRVITYYLLAGLQFGEGYLFRRIDYSTKRIQWEETRLAGWLVRPRKPFSNDTGAGATKSQWTFWNRSMIKDMNELFRNLSGEKDDWEVKPLYGLVDAEDIEQRKSLKNSLRDRDDYN